MTPGEEGLRVLCPIGTPPGCVECYTNVNMTETPLTFLSTVAAHPKPQMTQDLVSECSLTDQDGNA